MFEARCERCPSTCVLKQLQKGRVPGHTSAWQAREADGCGSSYRIIAGHDTLSVCVCVSRFTGRWSAWYRDNFVVENIAEGFFPPSELYHYVDCSSILHTLGVYIRARISHTAFSTDPFK